MEDLESQLQDVINKYQDRELLIRQIAELEKLISENHQPLNYSDMETLKGELYWDNDDGGSAGIVFTIQDQGLIKSKFPDFVTESEFQGISCEIESVSWNSEISKFNLQDIITDLNNSIFYALKRMISKRKDLLEIIDKGDKND